MSFSFNEGFLTGFLISGSTVAAPLTKFLMAPIALDRSYFFSLVTLFASHMNIMAGWIRSGSIYWNQSFLRDSAIVSWNLRRLHVKFLGTSSSITNVMRFSLVPYRPSNPRKMPRTPVTQTCQPLPSPTLPFAFLVLLRLPRTRPLRFLQPP